MTKDRSSGSTARGIIPANAAKSSTGCARGGLLRFPMYYAQEIAGTDDLLRMHGDWKELISVSRGFDRKLFAAFLETSYVHCCDDRLYVFDETPPVCRTPREAQALRKRPCRFTAEYTPYDGALIFRDICSGIARQDIIQTVQAVCREHGKEPDVYLKEETDE